MNNKHLLTRWFAGFFALILIASTASSAKHSPLQNLEQAKFRVHEMLEALKPDPRPNYDKAREHAVKVEEFLEAADDELKGAEVSEERKGHARYEISSARGDIYEAVHELQEDPKAEGAIVGHAEHAQEKILKAIDFLKS